MNTEQAKYERLWGEHAQYRAVAPGEQHADDFILRARPLPANTVADFGCGTGRGALRIHRLTGATVRAFDFTANCLDAEVRAALGERLTFATHDLTQPVGEMFDFGYCTDVLEHIPPTDVDAVLTNIMTAARRLYLNVSTVDDVMGALIGEPLHLTVQPHAWWRETLERIGARIDHEQDHGESSVFYCSIYASGKDFEEKSSLNVPIAEIKENIRRNLALGLSDVVPHEAQDTPICLLAGGPSLADHEAEIIERGRRGELFVTCNGTYKWLLDRGIRPAAQFMVDAREFNARFLDPIIDSCRYILSSQVHNEVVKKCPPAQTLLFHSGDSDVVRELFEEKSRQIGFDIEWYPIYGGSTVIGRALVVLAMLGYRNVEVIGWDSCLRDGAHHAYAQPENDREHVVDVEIGGRSFRCHPWMVVQANEVPKLIRHILGKIEGFQLNVRGDGLIAHMINHAAALAAKE